MSRRIWNRRRARRRCQDETLIALLEKLRLSISQHEKKIIKALEKDVNELCQIAARGEAAQLDYEAPQQPDLVLDTESMNTNDCVDRIMKLLEEREIIHIDDDDNDFWFGFEQ